MRLCQLLALCVVAQPIEAQAAAAEIPAAGTRVRLETSAVSGKTVTGALSEMNQGYVSVALGSRGSRGSQIVVPWSRISAVSFSSGRDGRTGAATGALLGLAASLVVYPALTSRGQRSNTNDSRLGPALISFGLLPLAGAVAGRFGGPERWRPLAWRPTQDTVMLDGEMTRLHLAPETEITVRTKSRWIKARVLDTTDDSLVVHTSARRQSFSWPAVSQLNLRTGRSRTRGAALGLSLMGGVTIAMLFSNPPATTDEKRLIIVRNLLAGAGVGALVGSPAWSRVPLPVR